MELIATLPPPYREQIINVVRHSNVNSARFNVGVRVPDSPKKTLEGISRLMQRKPLWIDLKCRQLRIEKWADPTYGHIELNHSIEVDLPSKVVFRGGDESIIKMIDKNVIYVDPPPQYAVGAGQAINIHGDNLKINGFLTNEDKVYIEAAKGIGIHKYMLSFVEEEQDIEDVLKLDPQAEIAIKIETQKGISLAKRIDDSYKVIPVVALDDLLINIGVNKMDIFHVLNVLIKKYPSAIVASRILTSLENSRELSFSDRASLLFLYSLGYRRFMLSDGLCFNPDAFSQAMYEYSLFKEYIGGE